MKPIDTDTAFQAVADSRIGGRRENQDTCAWRDTRHGLLLIVCDGMGGGPAGKTASTLAADTIVNTVLDSPVGSHPLDVMARAVRKANDALLAAVQAQPRLRGMGTTVTALLINRQSAVVAYVGDSRVYQLRGTRKVFRTSDHSRVFELVKAGALTEEEARVSGESNIITRALGVSEKVEPDIVELPYEKGDRFMLCSDGIWGALPEKHLLRITGGTRTISGAVESLVITVDNLGRDAGSQHDNLTVALLQTPFNSKLKQKMSTKARYLMLALGALCLLSITANLLQYRSAHRTAKDTPVATALTDSATVSEIAKIKQELDSCRTRLKDNDAMIRNLDESFKQQLDELIRQKSAATTANMQEVDRRIALTRQRQDIVVRIDELIDRLRAIGDIKGRKELNDTVKAAQKQFLSIQKEVQSLNIHNKEFDECVSKDWIKADKVLKNTKNPRNRASHIQAICDALESLKNQIRPKTETK